MAKPEYYDLLGIPSEEEAQTRAVLSTPAPASYGSYYQSFQNRRPQSVGGYGMSQRRIGVREWEQAQKKAAYEQNARRTLQQLTQIDPADPELTLKQEQLLMTNPYGQDLVRDPRVTSVLKSRFSERAALEKQFQDDPDSQTDYLIARQEGLDHRTAMGRAAQSSALRKERLWFAEKGGDLNDFDSGRFMRGGRFDKAAAMSHINQLTRSQKEEAKNKPWQERLSFKEGEAIRETARGAKSGVFQDFEDEFAAVQADNPQITRDAYVKQFKGVPDFNAYRQRRLMDAGQSLMDEYGLSQEEAAQVLGIRPQLQTSVDAPETAPVASDLSAGNLDSSRPVRGPEAMFEGQKDYSTGQPAVTAPSTPVSAADLKKIEPGKPAPVTFESIAAEVAARPEAEKRKREEEFLVRQKLQEQETAAGNELWEGAKATLLQGISPEMVATLRPSPTEAQFTEIFQRAGIDPSKPAFTYPAQDGIPGRDVSWYEVLTQGLAQDPRIKKIQEGTQAAAPKKSFSSLWGGK